MRLLEHAAAYFGLVFGAGFAFGVLRVGWAAPRFGERTVELLEMPVMLVVIVLAAWWTNRRFSATIGPSARLAVGLIALGFVLTADLVVGVVLRGLSLAEVLANRDPVAGAAYYAMLCVFAAMPWLLARPPRHA